MKRKIYSISEMICGCGYFYYYDGQININNGYNCKHPQQEEQEQDEDGTVVGKCYAWSCPLGCEADEEDFENPDIDKNGWTEWQDCEFVIVGQPTDGGEG